MIGCKCPIKIMIIITVIILVAITIFSCTVSWKEVGGINSSSLPILLHIVCLTLICIVIVIITFLIFFKNNFDWFSTLGFFIYTVCELILIVNVMCMTNKHHQRMFIEGGVVFSKCLKITSNLSCLAHSHIRMSVLLCLYTQCASWHYGQWVDEQRRRHEEYIERQISSSPRFRGNCVTIPLTGSFSVKVGQHSSNFAAPKPGVSSRR